MKSPKYRIGRVCAFCGSSNGVSQRHVEAAQATGRALLQKEIGLVYGGGCTGLMGTIADTVLNGGGEVIGVIPQAMVKREVAHQGLSELRIVHSMHERKAMMADLADGFIALPGGYGTLEELCEIITWAQLGLHRKPCGILNVEHYYDPLLSMFDRGVSEGFISSTHRKLVLEESDPLRLLELFVDYDRPPVERQIERDES